MVDNHIYMVMQCDSTRAAIGYSIFCLILILPNREGMGMRLLLGYPKEGGIGVAVHSLTFKRGLERFMLVKVTSLFCCVGGFSKKDSFVGGCSVKEITATATGSGQEREKRPPRPIIRKHALSWLSILTHTRVLPLRFLLHLLKKH